MTSTYLYDQLKHRQDIRLFHINPQSGEKPIEVTLGEYRLNSDISFTALSYVWGEPMPQSWIVCNGYNIPITYNLLEILSHLQKQGFEGLLWVDAICINQQDNQEKSIQVSMMRDIYKRAVKVIFWLGAEEKHDRDAIRLMNRFVEKHPDLSDMERLRVEPLDILGLPFYDPGWAGWVSLFSRAWFERVWIVQEFLNASSSVFMSGALEIPTELIVHCAHAMGVCASIGGVVTRLIGDMSIAKNLILRPLALSIDQIARKIAGDGDIRIVDLWTRSQLLKATDPRDRVFALLSTQTAVDMDLIDYSKDLETVYMDIASIALTMPVPMTEWYNTPSCALKPDSRGNGVQRVSRFLACKVRSPHPSDLPSWVPDWRPVGFNFVPLTRYYPGSALFSNRYNHVTIEKKILSIQGIIVDSPRVVIDSMPYMQPNRPYILPEKLHGDVKAQTWVKRMLDWQTMCYLCARGAKSSSTDYEFLEAFCRAMAFGALPGRSTAPGEKYIAGFRALHQKLASGMHRAVSNTLAIPNCNTSANQDLIYESVFQELSVNRKFCITSKGSLAWVPKETTLGDKICFLAGCAVPFVVRAVSQSFELIGDCYLHGMMCDQSIMFKSEPQLFRFQ